MRLVPSVIQRASIILVVLAACSSGSTPPTSSPPEAVASVAVTATVTSAEEGETAQLSAVPRNANGIALSGRSVAWASNALTVATVSGTGLVSALAEGEATISATSEGRSGSVPFSVRRAHVATVTVAATQGSLTVGETTQLSATMRDARGRILNGRAVTWSTSAPNVASVSASGLVTAAAVGTATITATSEGQTGSVAIAVTTPPPVPVASVAVSAPRTSLTVGETTQLTATTRDAGGAVLTGRAITWSTSASNVVTVSAAGLVTAVAAGTATITATSEGRSGSVAISVTTPPPAPVATVAVTAPRTSLTVGETTQLTATTRDAAGAVLTGRVVTWSTSASSIASVSSSGLVTAVATGTATITATSEGRTGSVGITVTAATPTPSVGCANPGAGWLWCDDFEVDRTRAGYFEYDAANGSFLRESGSGRNSGYGMHSHFAPGQINGGSLKIAIGRTPDPYFRPVDAGTANYREIYWRVYMNNAPTWRGGFGYKMSRATVLNGSDWSQAAFAHVWGANNTTDNRLFLDPASGTDAAGNVVTHGYNDFPNMRWLGSAASLTPITDIAHIGRWYCVEAHARLNDPGQSNGAFELRIDGVLEAQRTGMNWVGAYNNYGWNAILLENYWNAPGATQANDRYFDDFVVSTQPIGCSP